jgi:ABC-type multidrug transport system fused ATPase/permease subunit
MSTFSLASDANDWVVPSLMAYVPQSAWLQNDSIKQNVLFGTHVSSEVLLIEQG